MELVSQVNQLYGEIAQLIKDNKSRVAVKANAELTLLYFKVGRHINHFILNDNRAAFGKQIIINLSVLLTQNFGSVWGDKQIRHCLRTAETITEEQIVYAVSRQLSWTHIHSYDFIRRNPLKRHFYLEMAIIHRWNTRTLSDQIDNML
jgi:DUF1016 N-terminal domain